MNPMKRVNCANFTMRANCANFTLRARCALSGAMALLFMCAMIGSAQAQEVELKSIAILDFELIDDQRDLVPATVEYDRLVALHAQLTREFASNRLYRVVDLAPAAELLRKHQSEQRLHECNGCELEIARALSADRVLVGWVQKVSNLILNFNIQIEDTATGAILLNKSVDMRGNNDESWRRSASYLVRSMVEKNQGNR